MFFFKISYFFPCERQFGFKFCLLKLEKRKFQFDSRNSFKEIFPSSGNSDYHSHCINRALLKRRNETIILGIEKYFCYQLDMIHWFLLLVSNQWYAMFILEGFTISSNYHILISLRNPTHSASIQAIRIIHYDICHHIRSCLILGCFRISFAMEFTIPNF